MADETARWWAIRRAHSHRPATYRCPFCGRMLHAMSEHVLIAPEGDSSRRRHAHADCVARARAAGTLKTLDDWRAAEDGGRRRIRLPWRRSRATG
jgi:hypothetical protein